MKKARKNIAVHATKSNLRPFPPRRDFASLSLGDLLEAREAYRVHLASLENVIATAVGLYRIHEDDWYATHPPDQPRPADFPRTFHPRTLTNSIIRPWSWPAVLVFVRQWKTPDRLGAYRVPRTLYLPDGRAIPTCVILASPDESQPPLVPGPSQASPLLGGGYSCIREHQGEVSVGTVGCLVKKEGSFYALTNRHVAGNGGEIVRAYVYGKYRPIGTTADAGVSQLPMSAVFPSWPGNRTSLKIDAGLVRIDDIDDWTSQAFGIGEIGEAFDATEQSVTLDLIGCPVRAFGGTSAVMEGEIHALFFRYETLGGNDRVTDILIGSRSGRGKACISPPMTRPGDSGTLWFYDPPSQGETERDPDIGMHLPPERGRRARRLRPVAMQWGGQRIVGADGSSSAFALASFVSSVLRALEVDVVRDWSIGHGEYWGKLAHFAVGWKACGMVSGQLSTLMMANQHLIGFGDERLGDGSAFKLGRKDFVPLADVPDYVWLVRSKNEAVQHFADIDIYDIDGNAPLLERCHADPLCVSATIWKAYFDGFAEEGAGPEEGVLPFRVWQIWDAMVEYLKAGDVVHFVAAAGILAHYAADASHSLHCSYLHHGIPPMLKRQGRRYPVRKPPKDTTDEVYEHFKKSRAAKIHSIYDEVVLEVDTPAALVDVDKALKKGAKPKHVIRTGHDAAVETVRLMYKAHDRLPPMTIIKADDPELTLKERASALWENTRIRRAIVQSVADSVYLLADLWTSAWKEGEGNSIHKSELKKFDEDDVESIYRTERDFLPALSLKTMVKSGKFEPPA